MLARLQEFLKQHSIPYRVVHHPPVFTAQELAAVLGVKGRQFAKVVVLAQEADLLLAVLPADHRIDFTQLPGTRLATEPEIKARFADCAVGTVSPFGQLFAVTTIVDEAFSVAEEIAFEAGTHSDAVKLSYADFIRVENPQVKKFAAKAP